LDFAYDAASVESLDQFRLAVTAGIRRVVAADLASYTEIDLGTGRVIAPLDPQIDAGDQIAALGRLAHQHPLVTRSSCAAQTISDYISRRRFRSLDLYQEVYRPLEAEDQLAINLLPAGHPVQIGIALNRPRATFTAADREALDFLRPLLVRAYGRSLARERQGATAADRTSPPLTPRQRDVLVLVAQGVSNQQIALELGISRRTVENHLYAAYRRLGVTNRTAAAALARQLVRS
jgi:DNA-binding CsgD family transcriptional regulator